MCWRHLCETGIRSEVTDSCVGSDEGNWLTQEHSLQVGGGESLVDPEHHMVLGWYMEI